MKSLKTQYFYSITTRFCSISDEDSYHKIKYCGELCSFDGYDLINDRGKLIKTYFDHQHKKGNRFKLLSVVSYGYGGKKNYLGKCIRTKTLTTFAEDQISFTKPIISNDEDEE